MIVSEFLDRLDDVIDDEGHVNYPDEQRIRELDQQVRSLWRVLVDANKEHGNFTFVLQKEAARAIMRNQFEWRLPSWCYSVARVFTRTDSPASNEPTLSPYMAVDPTQLVPQTEIPKRKNMLPGWEWQGSHTLRLVGWTVAPELVVLCSKLPPRTFVATINTPHTPASATALYLPATLTHGNVDLEEGAYINADVTVTTTNGANDLHLGQTRRCIYSNAAVIVSGSRMHELTFDAAYAAPIAVGDVVETVLPIQEAHTRYLVLRTAHALFEKKANKEAMQAIAQDLATESRMFMEFATTRDFNGPYWPKRRSAYQAPRDRDRLAWYGIGW